MSDIILFTLIHLRMRDLPFVQRFLTEQQYSHDQRRRGGALLQQNQHVNSES